MNLHAKNNSHIMKISLESFYEICSFLKLTDIMRLGSSSRFYCNSLLFSKNSNNNNININNFFWQKYYLPLTFLIHTGNTKSTLSLLLSNHYCYNNLRQTFQILFRFLSSEYLFDLEHRVLSASSVDREEESPCNTLSQSRCMMTVASQQFKDYAQGQSVDAINFTAFHIQRSCGCGITTTKYYIITMFTNF